MFEDDESTKGFIPAEYILSVVGWGEKDGDGNHFLLI